MNGLSINSNTRKYLLNRSKEKEVDIENFAFDKMQCVPLHSLFTQNDIDELHKIATSIKLASKSPKIKFKMIDDIMASRGFRRYMSGTNRITYSYLEDDRFLVKVAYNNAGLSDSPREYQNQWLFAPFVAKVFEVSPCGTVALVERVNPIKSGQQFVLYSRLIHLAIKYIFANGEYVLDDIGINCFMNWGVRDNFGPVLLDYPYVYKLDSLKLICSCKDPTSPSGKCDGIIDYDYSYTSLYCTKCGTRYRASELAKAIEDDIVIVDKESKGGKQMRLTISGGTNGISKQVDIGSKVKLANSLPVRKKDKKYIDMDKVFDDKADDTDIILDISGGSGNYVTKNDVQDNNNNNDDDLENKENVLLKEALKNISDLYSKSLFSSDLSVDFTNYMDTNETFNDIVRMLVYEYNRMEDESKDELVLPFDDTVDEDSDENNIKSLKIDGVVTNSVYLNCDSDNLISYILLLNDDGSFMTYKDTNDIIAIRFIDGKEVSSFDKLVNNVIDIGGVGEEYDSIIELDSVCNHDELGNIYIIPIDDNLESLTLNDDGSHIIELRMINGIDISDDMLHIKSKENDESVVDRR